MNKTSIFLCSFLMLITSIYALTQERTDLAIFLAVLCVYIELINKETK